QAASGSEPRYAIGSEIDVGSLAMARVILRADCHSTSSCTLNTVRCAPATATAAWIHRQCAVLVRPASNRAASIQATRTKDGAATSGSLESILPRMRNNVSAAHNTASVTT